MKKKKILFLGLVLLALQTPSLNAQSLIEQYFAKMAEPLNKFETAETVVAHQRVFLGGKRRSRLVIPLI